MERVRVAVADDDRAMRETLRDVLLADPRVSVVGVVSSGPALVDLARVARPDVAVVDVGADGAATTRALVASTERPVVVAVSARSDRVTVVELLRAGAACYLAKDRIGGSLGDVVVRAHRGEVVLAVEGAQDLVRDLV